MSHGAGPLDPVVLDLEPFEVLASVIELDGQSRRTDALHGVLPLLFRARSGDIGLALKRSDAVARPTDG